MIIACWLLSALISIPPLLGWGQVRDILRLNLVFMFMVASLQVTNDEWYKSVRDIQWSNNMSVEQFVQYLNENQSTEYLQNFTKYLEGVVFPQCTVCLLYTSPSPRDS